MTKDLKNSRCLTFFFSVISAASNYLFEIIRNRILYTNVHVVKHSSISRQHSLLTQCLSVVELFAEGGLKAVPNSGENENILFRRANSFVVWFIFLDLVKCSKCSIFTETLFCYSTQKKVIIHNLIMKSKLLILSMLHVFVNIRKKFWYYYPW